MRRKGIWMSVGVACLLLLVGCTQDTVPSGGKAVKVTVPNLMSG